MFSVDLGSVDVTDSSVTRALFSATNDNGDYGSLAYDAGTGTFTFNKVTDSDIRGSLSVSGDLTYDPPPYGRFIYTVAQIMSRFDLKAQTVIASLKQLILAALSIGAWWRVMRLFASAQTTFTNTICLGSFITGAQMPGLCFSGRRPVGFS